jgi:hypothetical protein
MEIYRQLLGEAEKSKDIEFYDRMNVEQEAVLIHDWRKAARTTMEKVAYYL